MNGMSTLWTWLAVICGFVESKDLTHFVHEHSHPIIVAKPFIDSKFVPVPEPGCCAGDSERAAARCIKADDQTTCDRRSSCHWIETDDSSDCEWTASAEPVG